MMEIIANVRLQMDGGSGEVPKRAIVEFILGSVILNLLVANLLSSSEYTRY